MLSFRKRGQAYEILYHDVVVFAFPCDSPFIYLGEGKSEFSMRRGSFRVRDSVTGKIPFMVKDIKREDSLLCVTLADSSEQQTFEWRLTLKAGQIHARPDPAAAGQYNRMWLHLPAVPEEHVYGCGENFTHFDLRGEKAKIWVQEHNNLNTIIKKVIKETLFGKKAGRLDPYTSQQTYYVQPTFMSSRKYFAHVHSDAYMEFDFRNSSYHEILIHDIAEVTLGFADDFEGLSENLTKLLGRQPLMPEWAYDGVILGIQGGTQTVEEKLASAEQSGMRIAGVWCQDWQGARVTAVGKQLMWNWEWAAEQYPELDRKIAQWKQKGVHFMGYINPFLAVEKGLYQYASKMGYCVKDKNGKDYLVKSTTFASAMVDFTNPDAYEWIKNIIKENMIDFGLDGWMADFGEYLPADCVLYSGEDPARIHNAWPAIWAKINREAVEERGKIGEIFFFTRAGHSGTVRHSTMMWNGDQYVDWCIDGGMPSVIPASLSLSVCGFGLSHSDVGGFSTFLHVKRSKELLMRWAEMNAFSCLSRSHEGIRPDDNAQFDADKTVLNHYAKMSRIHAALKPYLMAADRLNHTRGIPVTRPLFYYYSGERDYSECYEYLLGREILVAPVVVQGAKEREVYLPEDIWVHLWSGQEFKGGMHTVPAQLGRPPVFCRKGSGFLPDFLELKAL